MLVSYCRYTAGLPVASLFIAGDMECGDNGGGSGGPCNPGSAGQSGDDGDIEIVCSPASAGGHMAAVGLGGVVSVLSPVGVSLSPVTSTVSAGVEVLSVVVVVTSSVVVVGVLPVVVVLVLYVMVVEWNLPSGPNCCLALVSRASTSAASCSSGLRSSGSDG
jgi:hypothetical protein